MLIYTPFCYTKLISCHASICKSLIDSISSACSSTSQIYIIWTKSIWFATAAATTSTATATTTAATAATTSTAATAATTSSSTCLFSSVQYLAQAFVNYFVHCHSFPHIS